VPLYCTEVDVARHAGGAKRLTELSDTDADGGNDSGLVDAAIDAAEALVNSYARKQYEVPFPDPAPPSIQEITAGIAVYNLKSWRDAITEGDQVKQDARVEWLENLAKGIVDPGVSPVPASSAHVAVSNTARPNKKAVSRDKLKGFS
jgi:phage gp36-like protein